MALSVAFASRFRAFAMLSLLILGNYKLRRRGVLRRQNRLSGLKVEKDTPKHECHDDHVKRNRGWSDNKRFSFVFVRCNYFHYKRCVMRCDKLSAQYSVCYGLQETVLPSKVQEYSFCVCVCARACVRACVRAYKTAEEIRSEIRETWLEFAEQKSRLHSQLHCCLWEQILQQRLRVVSGVISILLSLQYVFPTNRCKRSQKIWHGV
jgi:hypothetical protein